MSSRSLQKISFIEIYFCSAQVVGTIPKHQINDKGTIPRTMGLSRKYVGPVRYPVTPVRPSNIAEKQRLSLLADNVVDKQVFI